jgi:selenium-binding protein 1
MDRREFLSATAAAALVGSSAAAQPKGAATPAEAMKGPRERHLFVTCTYANTGIDSPDYVAVIDVDPESKSYSEVVQGLSGVAPGDE